ncbi:AAA family ATPase [Cohnella pontilimi]|uniref:AAA family ATPase n=1 Tax=Cohnella pontilimi TaxID=2564100 RepID=UPI001FE6E189|nr:AAA family ATPase [Cohnella pontilimi]
MPQNHGKTVYLISGPVGVGKSTTAGELSRTLQGAAVRLEGDLLMHMPVQEVPWEKLISMTWENIVLLTRNFLVHGFDVVVDYVVEEELMWFCEKLKDLDVDIRYIVLWADETALSQRLKKRGDEYLINRSVFLMQKLANLEINRQHLLDISSMETAEVVASILSDSRYSLKF